MKLNRHANVINRHGVLYLQDYKSIVAKYDIYNKILTFGKDWNYSNTTLKTIYNFIFEFVEVPEIREVNNQTEKKEYLKKIINNKIILVDNLEEELYN